MFNQLKNHLKQLIELITRTYIFNKHKLELKRPWIHIVEPNKILMMIKAV